MNKYREVVEFRKIATGTGDMTQGPGQSQWEMGNPSLWGPSRCSSEMACEFSPYHDYLGLAELVSRLCGNQRQEASAMTSMRHRSSSVTMTSQDMAADVEDVLQDFHSNGRDYGLMPFMVDAPVDDRRRAGRLPTSKTHSRCAPTWCVFCKNNGESEMVFASHILKDDMGKITCPILRAYTCPLCGQNGDYAHTIKYCPTTKGEVPPAPLKTARTSTGRKRTVTQSSQTINELFM